MSVVELAVRERGKKGFKKICRTEKIQSCHVSIATFLNKFQFKIELILFGSLKRSKI